MNLGLTVLRGLFGSFASSSKIHENSANMVKVVNLQLGNNVSSTFCSFTHGTKQREASAPPLGVSIHEEGTMAHKAKSTVDSGFTMIFKSYLS